MKHLIDIINNEIDHEKSNPKGSHKRGGTPKNRRLAYVINGYTFFLTRKNWAEYSGVGYGTLCGRDKVGRPVGQILGYEELTRKKGGRTTGSKNKVSLYDSL